MSILELLQHIVNEPAPKMTPEGRFPPESEEFVNLCLLKDPDARWTPKELLVSIMNTITEINWFLTAFAQNHAWIQNTQKKDVDLVAWTATF